MSSKVNPEASLHRLAADKQQLLQQDLFRQARLVQQRDGARIRLDGKWLHNFCSNDYLGLSSHAMIIEAMQTAAAIHGTGSTASPLVCGKTVLHHQFEQKLAKLTGRDRALLLSCGYMANLAVQSALIRSREQTVIEDRLCHASIVDAAVLTRAQLKRYRHASTDSLEQLLKKVRSGPALVLTESVFSMDGDIAPLPAIVDLCRRHNACLVVDDAHGFGVLGKSGLGATEHFMLGQQEVPVLVATFGKAAGVYGAFIAGPEELIESLVQYARPYIYSTALPVPVIAAASSALDLIQQENWRRDRLVAMVERFRQGAERAGINILPSQTPIQPIIIGDPDRALRCSRMLEQDGYYVSAIRPPTVPRNSSRLRVTITANHTEEQIDGLLVSLHRCLSAVGLLQEH